MRIYSLSKVIALPFILMAVVIFYFMMSESGSSASFWIIPLVLALTVIFVFHPQIDFWYLQRNPIPLDPKMKEWLMTFSPFYRNLDTDDKVIFDSRICVYTNGREFKSIGKEKHDVPHDIQMIIASVPVQMTFYKGDYLFGGFERIFLYKHPFPSPRYQFLHTVEIHEEDGVMIFSLEHLLPGITRPASFFNIVLHAYILGFIHNQPKIDFPDVSMVSWEDLEQISGFSEDFVLSILGYESVEVLPVVINYFFSFPGKLRALYPDIYQSLSDIFQQDPSVYRGE